MSVVNIAIVALAGMIFIDVVDSLIRRHNRKQMWRYYNVDKCGKIIYDLKADTAYQKWRSALQERYRDGKVIKSITQTIVFTDGEEISLTTDVPKISIEK